MLSLEDCIALSSLTEAEIAAIAEPPRWTISASGASSAEIACDAAHAEHLHLDLGLHGRSANYRVCEQA